MVMAIYFIDEGDARLGIFVCAGNDAIPDVGGEDHSRPWWFFDCVAVERSAARRKAWRSQNVTGSIHLADDKPRSHVFVTGSKIGIHSRADR